MASIIQNFPAAELSKKGPAMLRTVEAWYFSVSAYACSIDNGANAPKPSIWVPGEGAAKSAGCLCAYAQDTSTLIFAFDGGLPLVIRSLELHYSKEKLTTERPFYLTPEDGLGDDAEVVAEYNNCFSSLLPGIETAVSRLVPAGQAPLKILCTGFCMGGGLAVLAAPWAALRWPNSDISCITFGAPIIGNAGFNKSFNLLVGLSYRGIYRLDPVPDMPKPFNKLSIKLCATGDDFYFDGRGSSSLHSKRPLLMLHHNLSDHTTVAYDQGISAAAQSPSPGVPVTADGRAVLVDPRVAGEVPELAERGDCECAQSCPCVVVPGTGVAASGGSTACSSTVIKTVMDDFEMVEKKMESNIALKKTKKDGITIEKISGESRTGGSAGSGEIEKNDLHRSGVHREGKPMSSCITSPSNALFSCLRCLSSPVVGERNICGCTAGGSGGSGGGGGGGGLISTGSNAAADPHSVRLDQFWAEMHLQAEALRESSTEVMSYMNQVFLGKSAQPPEVVQTAMAASLRLGQQADGDKTKSTTRSSTCECSPTESSSGADKCPEQVVVELPSTSAGSSSSTGSTAKEKDRIKRVAAKRLALPATAANASYLSTAADFSSATKIQHVTCVRDPRTDATAFIGWIPDESTAVLSFRGTASRSDALADLKFLPRQIEFLPELFPGATAHLGFLTHFTGLTSTTDEERNVATALLKLTQGIIPHRVICTGHSMGGALACLGATWAALQFPTAEIRCITFGAPRVGNSRFIRAFKTLVGMRMRVIHGADPIPAVPPPLRYSHFQPTVFLRRGHLEWRPEGWHRRLALALNDHPMLKYIACVAAVLEAELEGKNEVRKVIDNAASFSKTVAAATKKGEEGREKSASEGENEVEKREIEAELREKNELAAVAAAVMRAPWTWLQALGSRGM